MGLMVDQLSPALKKQPIWLEMMECFDAVLDPLLDQLDKAERSRSIFTADSDDLDLIIEESGDVFNVEWNVADDKPLSVLWRKDELKFKTSAIPIESMLSRSFVGLDSYWDAYYCHKNDEYKKENFKTLEQIGRYGESVEDHFLTSRGFLRIDVASMLERDISQEEIIGIIRGKLESIIPTHIVYDGIKFILSAQIENMYINFAAEEKRRKIEAAATLGMDTAGAEVRKVVVAGVSAMDEFARREHAEMDTLSMDFWPLDKPFTTGQDLKTTEAPIELDFVGQLGDGMEVHDEEVQLGDGAAIPDDESQLGSA